MIQSAAMVIEDAAVFAKLFSHICRRDQTQKLLSAFCSLRQARARGVLAAEMANVRFMTLPDADPAAIGRDDLFRQRQAQGSNALDVGGEGDASTEQWEQIRETWAYGKFFVYQDGIKNLLKGCFLLQTQKMRRTIGGFPGV
jgi:salicylate hydroxylase